MLVSLGSAAELMTASAFAAFLPKMVQTGFGRFAAEPGGRRSSLLECPPRACFASFCLTRPDSSIDCLSLLVCAGLTAGFASIAVGAVVVPGAAGGIFLGGYVVKKYKVLVSRLRLHGSSLAPHIYTY